MDALVEIVGVSALRFDDGTPVRAASAVAPFGDGWLVAQDESTLAAWIRPGSVQPLRVLPPVEGLDVFSVGAGTKPLKPDLEAACALRVDGRPAVLLLGSGSSPARMRGALVQLRDGRPQAVAADLTPLYTAVAAALGTPVDRLNLEGACTVGERLRWFTRANRSAGLASASVDLDLPPLLAAFRDGDAALAAPGAVRHYDLGEVDGVGLAVTDAVTLPDGRVLAGAAAEDTPNAIDDGRVTGAALVVLDDAAAPLVAPLPPGPDGRAWKIEGLAVRAVTAEAVDLFAVVDADDHDAPSAHLTLRLRLPVTT